MMRITHDIQPPTSNSRDAGHRLGNWELALGNWRLSSNLDESELFLPLLLHEREQISGQPAFVDEPPCLTVRGLHDVPVANQIACSQRRQTRLARAEEISRTAELEVAFRDRKSIARPRHRLEPLASVIGPRRLVEQDAVRLPLPSPYSAAQLVELREPETLRV